MGALLMTLGPSAVFWFCCLVPSRQLRELSSGVLSWLCKLPVLSI